MDKKQTTAQTTGQKLIAELIPAYFDSVSALAERMKNNRSTVSQWKNGKKPIPKSRVEQLETLLALNVAAKGKAK